MSETELGLGNERLKEIFARTSEKLKEVVREFEITQDELHIAGDFLNRLGQSGFCRSLVDVMLAMTSVDVTARTAGGTRPNLEGPFHQAHPVRSDGCLIEQDLGLQPRLELSGIVRDIGTGLPIVGAEVDFWHADNNGAYDRSGSNLRGIVKTDHHGCYHVSSVVPRDYSDHDNDPIGELFRAMGRHNRRAAHIHVKVRVNGREVLTTQLFIPGSPYLDSDYVEGAVSDDLLVEMRKVETAPNAPELFEARFDFRVAVPVLVDV